MKAGEKGNVILLPRTIDYYQLQLTRLLETDRFSEAADLLRFLLQCRTDDERTAEEWRMLLEWMESQRLDASAGPDGVPSGDDDTTADDAVHEEGGPTETDLLKERVEQRAQHDRSLADNLLAMLDDDRDPERQWLALEQLAVLEAGPDDGGIDTRIADWIRGDRHPLIRFKALQVLKRRGYEGAVSFRAGREKVTVDVQDVPESMQDFPRQVQSVLRLVQDVCEMHAPGMADFVERIWFEYLVSVYGTAAYDRLVSMEEEDVPLWAAALHYVAADLTAGSDTAESLFPHYYLDESDKPAWRRCCKAIRGVFGRGPD